MTDNSAEEKPKDLEAGKKLDPRVLDGDDDFEEFPVEGEYRIDWQGKAGDDEEDDVDVWEDNWDDETVEDDFSKLLKAELEKRGNKTSG